MSNENSSQMNRSNNLEEEQNYVLDIYEKSNIRIPVEIIEDLQYMNIVEVDEIFKFIENQRHYWKMEHSKKPYRTK